MCFSPRVMAGLRFGSVSGSPSSSSLTQGSVGSFMVEKTTTKRTIETSREETVTNVTRELSVLRVVEEAKDDEEGKDDDAPAKNKRKSVRFCSPLKKEENDDSAQKD